MPTQQSSQHIPRQLSAAPPPASWSPARLPSCCQRALPTLPRPHLPASLHPPPPPSAGNSRDILFRNVSVQAHMNHAMGADGRAIMSVFDSSRMRIGTVEMHR